MASGEPNPRLKRLLVTDATPAPTSDFDPTPFVHPELRPFLELARSYLTNIELDEATVAAIRAQSVPFEPKPAPPLAVRAIPGPPGAPDVSVIVINAGGRGEAPRPAILHLHGGGFLFGDAQTVAPINQDLAAELDCVIVSVDYRLAPETPFPGALEDNYCALRWLHRNAEELGVDPGRIAVMGESAGGGHAATLAIAARDRGEIPLAFQALVYPMLDDRTGSTARKPPHIGALIWREQHNRFAWSALLGAPAGSDEVPAGAVPARVADLSGLPPAFIGVGSIDLFVDEDIEYARRLIGAGVAVDLRVVPGAFHGFEGMGDSPIARRFRADLVSALRAGLAPRS